MQIRIQSTGEVVYEQGFRAMHPNISMPQQLTEATINELGGDVVFEGPQASGGTVYQYSQAAGVEQIGGKWYTKYILGPVFTNGETTAAAQEAAYKAAKDAEQAKSVRASRDAKLAALDWTQGKDIADEVSGPAATLRQALRDVPSQAGFPWEITWPEAV
jgi:hypothetical protein